MIDKIFDKLFIQKENGLKSISNLELIITPECNLACSYCYFHKYGDALYPSDIRNHDMIITNLKAVYGVIQHNDYRLENLDLFSGEIWHTSFGVEILRITLEYNKKKKFTNSISIASNCHFVLVNEDVIQDLINEFKSIDIRLSFSCSIDGLYIDSAQRPYKKEELNRKQDDYDRIFKFLQKNCYQVHPMVSADSVKYWIDNYNWLFEMSKKYDIGEYIMMLEVRNGNWSDENISYYTKFLEHVFNHELREIYKYDFNQFIKDTFRWNYTRRDDMILPYNNLGLLTNDRMTCSVQQTIFLRVGDLAFGPCHRLIYDKFLYGHLKINDDHTFSIIDKNVEMAVKTLSVNPKYGIYGCENCHYNYFCHGPCLGANYEFCQDPFFMLDDKTCNMLKARIHKLCELYKQHGLLNLIENNMIGSSNRTTELKMHSNIIKILEGDK